MKYDNKGKATQIISEIEKREKALDILARQKEVRVIVDGGGQTAEVRGDIYDINSKDKKGRLAINYRKGLINILLEENRELKKELEKL